MTPLGKRFKIAADRQLDAAYINQMRRKCEELKLVVIDAAEQELVAPTLENVGWLFNLINQEKYQFVAAEFFNWLSINAVDARWNGSEGNRTLVLKPGRYTNFESVEVEDTKDMLNNVLDKIRQGI